MVLLAVPAWISIGRNWGFQGHASSKVPDGSDYRHGPRILQDRKYVHTYKKKQRINAQYEAHNTFQYLCSQREASLCMCPAHCFQCRDDLQDLLTRWLKVVVNPAVTATKTQNLISTVQQMFGHVFVSQHCCPTQPLLKMAPSCTCLAFTSPPSMDFIRVSHKQAQVAAAGEAYGWYRSIYCWLH